MSEDETRSGGCLCGKVRYTLAEDPVMCVTCHCKNCQRQAGSALSIIIGVREDAIAISGAVKTYDDTADSGAPVHRQFCDTCGSALFTRIDHPPGLMFVKAGTLDDTSKLAPAFHCWTKSKQDWVPLGDIPAYDTVPQQG
ncbi:GFA family protein [Erythrobacter sp.]|uniref:GFA family protein n=1 Tax=Erythrobacter sp. TaxID=1042 RepID=UPI001425E6D8|nr:GFA family protein [Erythrobacter sp.]QIQ85305.1 MAG: GFA family protein [Erythrobacter sp.]